MFTNEHAHYELVRLFGLVPIAAALILGYFWAVVCNLFNSISSLEKKNEAENNEGGCCNLNYRIGVQIMAGILTILSAVVLVLHYVKLDEEIKDRYLRIFKEESSLNLTVNILIFRLLEYFKEEADMDKTDQD